MNMRGTQNSNQFLVSKVQILNIPSRLRNTRAEQPQTFMLVPVRSIFEQIPYLLQFVLTISCFSYVIIWQINVGQLEAAPNRLAASVTLQPKSCSFRIVCIAMRYTGRTVTENTESVHFRRDKQHTQVGATEIASTKCSQNEIRGVSMLCSNASSLKYNAINARYFQTEDRADFHFFSGWRSSSSGTLRNWHFNAKRIKFVFSSLEEEKCWKKWAFLSFRNT